MSRRTVLVTGLTGQDGSYLAEQLLEGGDEVVGVVRPPLDRDLGHVEALRERLRLVAGDLAAPAELRDTIVDVAPDELFHLAAPTFVPASWEDPVTTFAEIASATALVLDGAARAGARVLVVSSAEVFGDAGISPQDESAPRRPLTPYGVAKLAAHELARIHRERGAFACAAITYNHESPRRPERFVTRKITSGVAAIARGEQDELVLGDLSARRDWSHAADVVAGMVLALRHDEPDDYVLASGQPRTVREFVAAAWAAAGLEGEPRVRVDPRFVRPPEPTVLVGDPSKARDVLGWRPRRSFDAMVLEMVGADLR